jgi:hypothetical protein
MSARSGIVPLRTLDLRQGPLSSWRSEAPRRRERSIHSQAFRQSAILISGYSITVWNHCSCSDGLLRIHAINPPWIYRREDVLAWFS